jgi:hypothetical protein
MLKITIKGIFNINLLDCNQNITKASPEKWDVCPIYGKAVVNKRTTLVFFVAKYWQNRNAHKPKRQ